MQNGFWQRGGAWVMVQFTLMIAVIALGIRYPGSRADWTIFIGSAALVAGGAVFGVSGAWTLGRNRTPFPRPRTGSEFIQHGVYARVRHPLYTSVMMLAFGWALLWRSWPSFLAAAVLIPFFQAKARREERWLRETFPGYAEYERRVPRFLPRRRQRDASG